MPRELFIGQYLHGAWIGFLALIVPSKTVLLARCVHFIDGSIALNLVSSIFARLHDGDTSWVRRYCDRKGEEWKARNFEFEARLDEILLDLKERYPVAIQTAHEFFRWVAILAAFFAAFVLYLEVVHEEIVATPW